MSQQQQYQSGELPPRSELEEFVSDLIVDLYPQKITLKFVRMRLEDNYKIDFTTHRATVEEIVIESIQRVRDEESGSAASTAELMPHATSLIVAAAQGDVTRIVEMLDDGADMGETGPEDAGVLAHAARAGSLEACVVLLDRGATSASAVDAGCSPLFMAAEGGHVDVCELLLEQETQTQEVLLTTLYWVSYGKDFVRCEDENFWICCHVLDRVVDGTFAAGKAVPEFSINTDQFEVWLPLHAAILAQRPDACEAMLQLGADVNATPVEGLDRTPLHMAADIGDAAICSLLLKHGASVTPTDEYGDTPLVLAADRGYADVCIVLLQWGATGCSAAWLLQVGAKSGSAELCELSLLVRGADVNICFWAKWGSASGQTALHESARCPLVCATLLENFADPARSDSYGWTPLRLAALSAASSHSQDEVRLLLQLPTTTLMPSL